MIKLKVIRKEHYSYRLQNNNGDIYQFELEFYDLEKDPSPGDYIYISKELLRPTYKEYSTSYCFGKIDANYGRIIKSEDDPDIIGIKFVDKLVYLKRYYG